SKALISASGKYNELNDVEDMGIAIENKSLDFSKVQEWKGSIVSKLTGGIASLMQGNKIEVVHGEAYFSDEKTVRITKDEYTTQTYNFKNCIIATGSRPIELPKFKWSDRVISSTGALSLEEVPEK